MFCFRSSPESCIQTAIKRPIRFRTKACKQNQWLKSTSVIGQNYKRKTDVLLFTILIRTGNLLNVNVGCIECLSTENLGCEQVIQKCMELLTFLPWIRSVASRWSAKSKPSDWKKKKEFSVSDCINLKWCASKATPKVETLLPTSQ